MGLAMALVLPNIGARRGSALHDEAVRVAQQLELARQLAVVTGTPHRLLIDVEAGAFRLEWFGDVEGEQAADEEIPIDPLAPRAGVDLSPPGEELGYQPQVSVKEGLRRLLDFERRKL
jgi:nucleoside-diphosphate-sugar epimerase